MDIHKTCQILFPRIPVRFRITSASKERILRPQSLKQNNVWSKKKLLITQNLKNRSHSLRNSIARIATVQDRYQKKIVLSQKQEIILSEPNQIISPRCKRIQTKEDDKSSISYKQNLRRIQAINRVFGPKKRAQNNKNDKTKETSTQSNHKNQKKQYKNFIKGNHQSKINQYIFQTRKKKFSISKQNTFRTNTQQQFWNKVNQSLIFATTNNQEQESKDLRDFVQNLITQ